MERIDRHHHRNLDFSNYVCLDTNLDPRIDSECHPANHDELSSDRHHYTAGYADSEPDTDSDTDAGIHSANHCHFHLDIDPASFNNSQHSTGVDDCQYSTRINDHNNTAASNYYQHSTRVNHCQHSTRINDNNNTTAPNDYEHPAGFNNYQHSAGIHFHTTNYDDRILDRDFYDRFPGHRDFYNVFRSCFNLHINCSR